MMIVIYLKSKNLRLILKKIFGAKILKGIEIFCLNWKQIKKILIKTLNSNL